MLYFALLIVSFYTSYKYSSDIEFLLEDPVSMATGGDHTLNMWNPAIAYWNPANIGEKSAGISHFSYYGSFVNVENIGISGINTTNYCISLFTSYVHSKPIELTELKDTSDGVTEGNIIISETYKYASFSLFTGIGKKIKDNIFAGMSFKYIEQTLPDYKIHDAGINLGFVYNPTSYIFIGGIIRNLIASRIENGKKSILKPLFNLTTSLQSEKIRYYVTISSEYDEEKDYSLFTLRGTSMYVSSGMEYFLSPKIILRAGTGKYGIGFGTGILIDKVSLDYAIRPFNNSGTVHKLAILYSLE